MQHSSGKTLVRRYGLQPGNPSWEPLLLASLEAQAVPMTQADWRLISQQVYPSGGDELSGDLGSRGEPTYSHAVSGRQRVCVSRRPMVIQDFVDHSRRMVGGNRAEVTAFWRAAQTVLQSKALWAEHTASESWVTAFWQAAQTVLPSRVLWAARVLSESADIYTFDHPELATVYQLRIPGFESYRLFYTELRFHYSSSWLYVEIDEDVTEFQVLRVLHQV